LCGLFEENGKEGERNRGGGILVGKEEISGGGEGNIQEEEKVREEGRKEGRRGERIGRGEGTGKVKGKGRKGEGK
jgi:hypothetical protein